MTGPVIAVAWQSRFVDGKWSECSREHVEWVRSVPHEWPGYEVRELYAAPQPAPAIDLEQFREAVESLRLGATRAEHHEECDRLLALIDGQAADPRIDLAADHTGMLVDYSGLIGSAQGALLDDPGIAEMLRQLCRHLEELGRRWYAGDRKVVDEFLQLYCIESDARAALV